MTDTSHLPESPLPDLKTVIGTITDAFAGVRLGNGIGLHEAEGIDDHENAETLARLRHGDEKENWAAIPAEDLHGCHSAFSFFDAKGARFHLPAFLIDDLKLPYGCNFDAVSFLTRTVPLYPEKVACPTTPSTAPSLSICDSLPPRTIAAIGTAKTSGMHWKAIGPIEGEAGCLTTSSNHA